MMAFVHHFRFFFKSQNLIGGILVIMYYNFPAHAEIFSKVLCALGFVDLIVYVFLLSLSIINTTSNSFLAVLDAVNECY